MLVEICEELQVTKMGQHASLLVPLSSDIHLGRVL